MEELKEKLEKACILPEKYQKALCGIVELFLEMAADEKVKEIKEASPNSSISIRT